MPVRAARIWRRLSFPVKFGAIMLVTGLAIAVIPLTLANGESQRQAEARAADKAGLARNLIAGESKSLQGFATALAQQVGPPISASDLLTTVERDSRVNGGTDVVGVLDPGGSMLIRAGAPMIDAGLAAALRTAAEANQDTAIDVHGQPWVIASAAVSATRRAIVARPLDDAGLTSLRQSVMTTNDNADIGIASSGRWVVSGTIAGTRINPGDPVGPVVQSVFSGRGASVVTLSGREVAVAQTPMTPNSGLSVVVSTVVVSQPLSTFWEPALLLVAVILVAMLFIIVIVRTDLQGPISRLDRAVAALGRGNLDVEIPTARETEVGRLGRSFDAMRQQMRATIHSNAARAAIASELNASQPLETALKRVAAEIRSSTRAAASLIVVGGNEMSDGFTVTAGIAAEGLDADVLLDAGGPLGSAFHAESGKAVQMGAAPGSPEARLGLRELCVAPLRLGRHTLGVIAIADNSGGLLPAQNDLVDSAAEQVALALERYRFLAMVQRQASIDDLTGLYNHRFMVDYLGQQVALAERLGTPLALLMCDLDHFKKLNDTHGHHVGDQALRCFAQTLLASVRRADLAARYGGEEFVVVMANTGSREALLVAEKIRAAVAAAEIVVEEHDRPLGITVSIGGAAFPEDTTSARELLVIADRALYAAKAAGRDRVSMAVPDIVEPPDHELEGSVRSRRTHGAVG